MKIINENALEIVFLLDASGSMGSYEKAVVTTFNEYIAKIRGEVENATVSLFTFDSLGIVCKFESVPLNQVRTLTEKDYKVGAATPLYDAIGTIVNKFQGNNINFLIHTDGYENASSEFTFEKIDSLVKSRTEKGAQFTWLG